VDVAAAVPKGNVTPVLVPQGELVTYGATRTDFGSVALLPGGQAAVPWLDGHRLWLASVPLPGAGASAASA
jgi:hypothetical protein